MCNYLFIINSLYCFSCCLHADQILPKLSAPQKRMSWPDVNAEDDICSYKQYCLQLFMCLFAVCMK